MMFAKRMRGALLVAAPLFLSAAPLVAKPVVSLGITGGTLGVGPEIGIRDRYVGARANATFLSFGHTFRSSDVDYDGQARLKSAGSMFDLYPFGGGFRISAGGRYNRNRGRVTAMPTQPTQVGGFTFTPAQIGTLSGKGSVRKTAPALTLGYGGRARRGFTFGVDAGAMFQGRIRISPLTSSTGLIPQTRLDAERADLQDDVGHYRVYPILQASLGWRF